MTDDDVIEDAINSLASGGAICFLGAGFSVGAKDANGKSVPDVRQLCVEIREFIGMEDDTDASLSDLADYCQRDPALARELQDLLIQRLTLCQPSASQEKILAMPWRSIFTTNFDDVAEVALKTRSPQIVTPSFKVKGLRSDRVALYYLHGRALDILRGEVDPGIVISEKNFLELKERNRDLYAALENEVHSASRIFIIGYSLRDMQIAERLFSIEGLKEKAIVINRPGEGPIALSRLEKFGKVKAIGVSGLAERLPDPGSMRSRGRSANSLSYVKKLLSERAKSEVTVDDVNRLILSGKFDYSSYAAQQQSNEPVPEYSIPRESKIEELFEAASLNTNRFVVTSDLGNGKSIFLNQLAFEAHRRSYDVYCVETLIEEIYPELDSLLTSTSRQIFIVDGFVRYRKIASYIGKRLPATSILVVTAGRSLDDALHANFREELHGVAREIDLNELSDEELRNWDGLLERWGLWGARIDGSESERFQYLKKNCGAENRAIILSIFKNSILRQKISNMVEFFLHRNAGLSRPFVAVLINALCQNHVDWLRIVEWLRIDQQRFRTAVQESYIADFMSGSHRWYEFTSAELASFILNHHEFDLTDIVDVYTKIVRETAYSANDPRSGFDARENLKELMRFRFLTKLFPEECDGNRTISAVYHRLSDAGRIRNNDQFWLQYAMARMEVDELEDAERYIETSLGIARKKGLDYSNRQIVDQRVRLRFRKNAVPGKLVATKEVSEAIDDLVGLLGGNESLIHPLRSSEHILNFLNAKIDELSPDLIERLTAVLSLMRSKLPSGKGRLDKSQKGETEKIRKNIDSCRIILANY